MRLGFHYHVPALEIDGEIRTPGYFGLFIDGLASECEEIVCFLHTPSSSEMDQMDYAIQGQNVRLVNLGPHNSLPKRLLRAGKIRKAIRDHYDAVDVMLVRGPSPLLPVIGNTWKKPLALLLVGDYLASIDEIVQPFWRRIPIQCWIRLNVRAQMKVSKRSLVFVNSRLLYDKYQSEIPQLVETQTTTLSEKDFYFRKDTCQQEQIRLLYTGRMARAKGLMDILDTFHLLRERKWNVYLDLVGMREPNDNVLEEFFTQVKAYDYEDRIVYHGYKTVGEELFQYYRQADIYFLASQMSEGFPRTIWEAMAHGVPVIATKVGSIPAYIKGIAYLVDPKDIRGFAQTVEQVILDQESRQKSIANGYTLVQKNTLEQRSKEMIVQIELFLSQET